jgi:hypothetical protein
MKMDDYKISDNFQRTEGFKINDFTPPLSPHHFHPTNGVRPSDSNLKCRMDKEAREADTTKLGNLQRGNAVAP